MTTTLRYVTLRYVRLPAFSCRISGGQRFSFSRTFYSTLLHLYVTNLRFGSVHVTPRHVMSSRMTCKAKRDSALRFKWLEETCTPHA
jgi:hypothetical protein